MVALLQPRLVRLQDRFATRDDVVWRINPRTGFLEARAGLSWTGVREYRTPTGLIRVLRRPEQVCSPGHLRTLRLLPCTDGHPAGDVDVTPANEAELRVGSTGDTIDVTEVAGYLRPVGAVSVSRPSTMVKMVDAATWAQIGERFPDLAKIPHAGRPPATGNSLGYNALWWGPHVDAEIKGERDDGGLIGEWQGPNGPEEYDVEHVIDPDCEIVRRLVREAGFDPLQLGGNHNAVALACLGGRGGQQTELMRIVDARDIALPFDLRRDTTRTQVSVPVQAANPKHQERKRDQMPTWTVGTDRDLPIASGAWDGPAAAESVFAWAGWPDAPDPARARRAFLIYDADAPDLKGSYKLPIARYRDGSLEVVDAGLRAAASRLPQTDAPQEVLDRARTVLDHYYEKLEKMQGAAASRDKGARKMKVEQIEIGLGRDNFNKLAKLGVLAKLAEKGRNIPQSIVVPLPVTDEMDPKMVVGKLEEMKMLASDLIEMVAEAMGEAESMAAEAEDAAAMKARCGEMEAAIAEKEKELAALKEQAAAAAKTMDGLKSERDSLRTEVEPLRAKELDELRQVAVQIGCAEDKVKSAKDSAEIRRLVASAKLGERYSETVGEGEAKTFRVSDSIVAGVYDGLIAGLQAAQPARGSADPTRDYAAPFAAIPQLVPHAGGGGQAKPKVKREQDEEIDDFTAGLQAAGG